MYVLLSTGMDTPESRLGCCKLSLALLRGLPDNAAAAHSP